MRYVLALALVAMVGCAPNASAENINEERKTHGVSGTVRRLVLDNESGEVTIRPGSSSSVTRMERWNLARPRYRQELEDGTLTLRASCPDVVLNNCSVDLDVTVPRAVRISAENLNGAVLISGFSGSSISAVVTNGSVHLEDLRVSFVRGSTENGDVSASLSGRPMSVRLSTTNGDVAASVPKGAYDIETDTTNGDVSIDGLEDDSRSRRTLKASTTNGDVSLSGR